MAKTVVYENKSAATDQSNESGDVSKQNAATEEKEKKASNKFSKLNRFLIGIIAVVSVTAIVLICWHFLRKRDKKPHVLLLIADDLGWADVGWHSSDISTPYLTGLAKDGIILRQFYSQPICTASRAALFTGRYPFKLGLQGSRPILAGAPGSLPLDMKLLPELMKKDGYKTHLVGKWHLGFETIRHTPVMRGFDTFTGFYNGMQDYYTHTTSGFDTVNGTGGYDMRRDYLDPEGNPVIDNILWGANRTYNNYLFTEEAIKIIEDHSVRHEEEPLLLVMSYPNPHSPIQVPDEFVNFQENSNIENSFRKTYAGLVYAMDCSVANITTALKEKDMFDDTIVIFISDNGGSLTSVNQSVVTPTGSSNYPLRGDKGTLWEAGSRVPAFISGRNVPKGQILDEMVHITDIYPTLISYLNLDGDYVSHDLDGSDQSKLLKMESKETAHEYFIYDIDPVYEQAAIRYGKWKLILGAPAANEVDGWYQPLKEGQTGYEDSGLPFKQYVLKAYDMISNYKASLKSNAMCKSVGCFYPEGTENKVKLFDLSVDQYEFNDVASQHPATVKRLLDILDKEMLDMVPPVNLLDGGVAEASPNHFNGTWMPWMDASEP
ncbi:hypothetical protein ACHWQZ_G014492 [Mnemiopsis leidyi]